MLRVWLELVLPSQSESRRRKPWDRFDSPPGPTACQWFIPAEDESDFISVSCSFHARPSKTVGYQDRLIPACPVIMMMLSLSVLRRFNWHCLAAAVLASSLTDLYAQLGADIDLAGSISVPGERDRFTFRVDHRELFYFDALTSSSTLNWSLESSAGSVVSHRSFTASDGPSASAPVLTLFPGDYTLTVEASNATTNDYRFRFLKLAGAQAIVPGTIVSNNLAPANETHLYTFTAAVGDKFQCERLSQPGEAPNLFWRLLDPYGHAIFERVFNNVSVGPLKIGGTYTLLLEGYISSSGTDSYSFLVAPQGNEVIPPLSGMAITLGGVVSGVLTNAATNDFRFTVSSEVLLAFDTLTNSPGGSWSLEGPTGRLEINRALNSSDGAGSGATPWLIPGEYQLRITRATSGRMPYAFRLLDLSLATPFTPGTPITKTLTPATATALYSFEARAGARYYFDFLSTNELSNAYWRLLDPVGETVEQAYVTQDRGPRTLPVSGRYTLALEGYAQDTAVEGQITFNVVLVQDTIEPLELGMLTSGSLTTPGQTREYRFQLASTTLVAFDSRTPSSSIRWSLTGPEGTLVNQRPFSASDGPSASDSVLKLHPGNYVISVNGVSDAIGDYQFRLFDIASGVPIERNAEIGGGVDPANQTVAYRFAGSRGELLFLDQIVFEGAPNLFWELRAPSGSEVYRGYFADKSRVELPETGLYILLVEGYVFDLQPGLYRFAVRPIRDGAHDLVIGARTAGRISSPGEFQVYRFTLSSASVLYFDSLSNNLQLDWTLDGSTDRVVQARSLGASDGPNRSAAAMSLDAGEYVLTIHGVGDETGDFAFRLIDLATATPYTPGIEKVGTLDPANESDLYRFDARAGDRFIFENNGTGSPRSYWRLTDPYGQQVFAEYMIRSLGTNTLPATGTYTLMIEGLIAETGTTPYQFNVSPNGNMPPAVFTGRALNLGEVVSGSLATPNEEVNYVFTLSDRAWIFFDSQAYVGNRWSLRGPPGLIVDSRPFWSSDGVDVIDASLLLPAGLYQLTVTRDERADGNYGFRLLEASGATPFSPGTVVTASMNPAKATALFRFSAQAGDRFYLDGQRAEGFVAVPYLRLYGPHRNILLTQTVNSDTDTFRLDETGDYWVAIEGRAIDTSASASFAFLLQPVTDGSHTLSIGAMANGTIEVAGQRQIYHFNLGAPKRLVFDALGQNNFTWTLASAAGTIVSARPFWGSDSIDASSSLLDLDAGDYSITVDAPGTATGDFGFRLLDTALAGTLTPGSIVNGTVNPGNGTFFYQFVGAIGDRYFYDGRATTGFSTTPFARLYTPLGGVLWTVPVNGNVDTFELPQDGTYILAIEGRYVDTSVGGQFTFLLVPNPVQSPTLILGSGSGPDLQVIALSVSPETGLKTGGRATVKWIVRNSGSIGIDRSFVTRITMRNVISHQVIADLTEVSTVSANSPIGSGETRNGEAAVTILDGSAAAGMLELTVAADSLNSIAEFNPDGTAESNNSRSALLAVALAEYPDLLVSSVVAPTSGVAGQEISVIWTVRNSGTAPAVGPWIDRILLASSSGSEADHLLGSIVQDATLAPGASLTSTQRLSLPVFGTGNRAVAVGTDAGNQLVELNEGNNTTLSSDPIRVLPSLAVTLAPLSVSENAVARSVQVTVTRNSEPVEPLVITLGSSAPNKLEMPGTVTMPKGAMSTTFFVSPINDVLVNRDTSVVITAAALDHVSGTSNLVIRDDDVPSLTLKLNTTTVREDAGASVVTARLSRNARLGEVTVVTISTDRPGAIEVPTSVTFPSGTAEVTIPLTPTHDFVVTGDRAAAIFAQADGYVSAAAPILVEEADTASLTLELSETTAMEGALEPGIIATVFRAPVTAAPQPIRISTTDNSGLSLPAETIIPANEPAVSFAVTVRDDSDAQGTRSVTLQAEALASNGESIPSARADAVLTILDNDGPTLTLVPALSVISERGQTEIAVQRNTPATNSLVIRLVLSLPDEATIPASVRLAPGDVSTNVVLSGVIDSRNDGPKEIRITASAAGYNPGDAVVTVTDIDLADFAVTEVTGPTRAVTDGVGTVVWSVTNAGLATASGPWVDQLFLALDAQGASATLLGSVTNRLPLAVGESYAHSLGVLLPSDPGQYWFFVKTDARNSVNEGSERNNSTVSSRLTVEPAYRAEVSTDVEVAVSGTAIPLHGRVFFSSDNAPAPFRPATVHIRVREARRTLQVQSDAAGQFQTVFQPIPGEAGVYTIGADHPRVRADAVQDQFTLLGMNAVPWELNLRLGPDNPATGNLELKNLAPLPLSGVSVISDGTPAGVEWHAAMPDRLAADATATVHYTVTTTLLNASRGSFALLVRSAEGASLRVPVSFEITPPTARLLAEPGTLDRGLVRGNQTLVSFDVLNEGGVDTGALSVGLPVVPWLSLVSPSTVRTLQPGERQAIVLALNPPSDLPLTRYDGSIFLKAERTSLTVPFHFRVVSDARGDLVLRMTDERTYFVEGAPGVTNGTIRLRDPISTEVVAEGFSGPDGVVRFSNLAESDYLIDAAAPKHSAAHGGIRVTPGTTIEQEVFLSEETVVYEWKVVPTEMEDHYRVIVEPLFETEVPQPSLVVENPLVAPLVVAGRTSQFEIRLRNTGLIALKHIRVPVLNHPKLVITPIVNELDEIPALSTVAIPVTLRLKTAQEQTGGAAIGLTSIGDTTPCQGTECVVHIPIDTRYRCGTNWVTKSAEVKLEVVCVPDTGCEFERLDVTHLDFLSANELANRAEWDCLMGKLDECEKARIRGYLRSGELGSLAGPMGFGLSDFCACGPPERIPTLFNVASNYLATLGFSSGGGGSFGSFSFVAATLPGPCNVPRATFGIKKTSVQPEALAPQGVCAKVRLQISQDITLTRTAFRGTLQIENNGDTPVEGVHLSIDFRDGNNKSVSELFAMRGPVLVGIDDVDGTGVVAPHSTGSAEYTFIPTLEAAPTAARSYYIGGTLRYLADGQNVVVPLLPGPITVLPEAQLVLDYFQQRDVYADDPFTSEVEPSEPFALGLRIRNVGAGSSRQFRISSSQPKIVENEKGLSINFQLVNTRVDGIEVPSNLTLTLGDIAPNESKVVIWDMVASLQGKFIDYRASFEHVDALGSKNISLIQQTAIHELIHVVRADRPNDDDQLDFLVNDLPDANHTPDSIYLSDGRTEPVTLASGAQVNGEASAANRQVRLTASVSPGWCYLELPDPGRGLSLSRVLRSDGRELRPENVWRTDRSFPASRTGAIREQLLHLLDYDSTGSYTLIFDSGVADTEGPLSSILALPATSPSTFPVQWSGSDAGSGIATFDLFVSINGGPYTNWIGQTTSRSAVFSGIPGNLYSFQSQATDHAGNREPIHLTADAQTRVTESENQPPVLSEIGDLSINEGATLAVGMSGTDPDSPGGALNFRLMSAPVGATIGLSSGDISWSTGESQGGSTNLFVVVASDNGFPSLSTTQTVRVIVREINRAPRVEMPQASFRVNEGSRLAIDLQATDFDLPRNRLSWSLGPNAPRGMVLEASTGRLTWTPAEADGPGTYSFSVTVGDDGIPSLASSQSMTVTVDEVNSPPVLAPVRVQHALVQVPLVVTNSASDSDLPQQDFFFSLAPGAPRGAKIDPYTGVLRWTPAPAYGAATNAIVVRVTDSGVPSATSEQPLTVIVEDYLQVSFSETIALGGRSAIVPLAIYSSAPVTNVSFVLEIPENPLGAISLVPSLLGLQASLDSLGVNQFRIQLRAAADTPLTGLTTIAELRFTPAATETSKFVPLLVTDVAASRADGHAVPSAFGQESRVILITHQPLLEMDRMANDPASVELVAYGPPGADISLLSTPSLNFPIIWTSFWQGTLDGLSRRFPLPPTNRASYFRVQVD